MRRIRYPALIVLILLVFVSCSYAMRPYVKVEHLRFSLKPAGIMVSGVVIAGNLNTPIPDSDYVYVFIEIPSSSVYTYPLLYEKFDQLEGCRTMGGRCLSKRELRGVNVVSIELFSSEIRKPHVWQRYGIKGWRKKAPDVVRVVFSGYVPLKYAGRLTRIHAVLRHVRGGPYALWPEVRFYHWVKIVRLPSYGYSGYGSVAELRKQLEKYKRKVKELEKKLWRCRLKLSGCIEIGGFEYNTDRPGMDYKHFKIYSTDPELCKVACDRDRRCKAWTFKKKSHSSGVCWLKYGVPAPVRNPACISGVKKIKHAATVGRYLGCYRDGGDPDGLTGRDLDGYMFVSKHGMTPRLCISICRKRGFAYAGLQYSTQCFCGNRYGKYGRAANCNMRCSGDKSKVCGGEWANSVYSTGLKVSSGYSNVFYGLNRRVTFYGKQIRGSVNSSATVEGNTLIVKRKAVILSYSSNAPSFCIWREGLNRPFACSGFERRKLPPGKYWLIPALGRGMYSSWVKVKVACAACRIE